MRRTGVGTLSGLSFQAHSVPERHGDRGIRSHHDHQRHEQQTQAQEQHEAALQVQARPHLTALVAVWTGEKMREELIKREREEV